jgi:hypothetical protein
MKTQDSGCHSKVRMSLRSSSRPSSNSVQKRRDQDYIHIYKHADHENGLLTVNRSGYKHIVSTIRKREENAH